MTIKSIFASCLLATAIQAGEPQPDIKQANPLQDEAWQFTLALPAWGPWLEGDSGANGKTIHIDLDPGDIIRHIDMAADVRAEARKGRLGVMGEFLYLSLSDGIGTKTVLKKVDLQVDQTMADLAFAWRVLESDRGYLDVIGGVRYTNFYQKAVLQPNDERIGEVAQKLASAATALNIARELRSLEGKDPTIPIAPLNAESIRGTSAAIKRIKGTTAERQEKIADVLHHALDRKVSRVDDWWDPYIGVRGRYNLNSTFYLTAKADIGGFGIGSDLTWQAEAALGIAVTKNVFGEIGYRAIGVDYDQDGFQMDTVTHGFQLGLGLMF